MQKIDRTGEEKLNNQGSLMKIIEYKNSKNVVVEFQDKYKTRTSIEYKSFVLGEVKNPYYPSVCNVGMIGIKYPSKENNNHTKEYLAWKRMLQRCFDEKNKEKHPTYKDVTCCDEWLLFENFYEWLHSQENFDKWINGEKWCIDKDILVKRNKIYSPDTCCLVPMKINNLFLKYEAKRGSLPIGVTKDANKFRVNCHNPIIKKQIIVGKYENLEEAFYAYKEYKENVIKQVAQEEFDKGNITEKCYIAMMNYKVEITD